MDDRDAPYIHGTSPEEKARLSALNDLLNERSLDAVGLDAGERVVDFGSGLGQFTRALARAAGPRGRVVGIERSREQIETARELASRDPSAAVVDFREGSAIDPPLAADEWGSFDLAHARFLLEHVPDPLGVVRAMVWAVRPGGRIILEDDDHEILRLHPDPPGVAEAWRAYYRTFERLGQDPRVGRKLAALLHEAGATPRRIRSPFFGSCAGDARFPAYVANFAGVLRGARDTVLAHGLAAPDAYDAALDELAGWGLRPDASLWYTTCWAEGIRPVSAGTGGGEP